MNNLRKSVLLIVSLLLLLLVSLTSVHPQTRSVDNNPVFPLRAPLFVNEASAASSPIGTKLDNEAGISAYYQSTSPINLNQVRMQFRTIETETADYIIGSVPVTNYIENFDAHVYVHKDGWILAYYLKNDPVSKIIDVKAHSIATTKLKTVVATVASAAGAPFTDVTYYDFRYPNATNILMVSEDKLEGNDFTIQIPSSYGYFERGWAMYSSRVDQYDTFSLDGVDISDSNLTWGGDYNRYGTISASELAPDVTHTIIVDRPSWDNDAYGVIVIVYRVP